MFFFVLRNVLEVLDRSSWSWRSQWILALAALDQLITCYIAWNSARISIAGVEAFLCAYYATSRQVALLSGDQERLLTTVRKIKESAASGSILGGISGPEVLNHQFSGGSSRMIIVDCFYASLALHLRQHRRLVVFAEALNSGLISPVLVATFLLNCLVNAAVLASFLYASLSTNDVIANLTILWFQVVNIGSVCTLCVRYSKALYRRLTPLSLQALNLSGPGQAVVFSDNAINHRNFDTSGGTRNSFFPGPPPRSLWNRGFRVERLKMAAFYEGLHQRVGGRGRFHFTVGPIAYITTKSVAEVCFSFSSVWFSSLPGGV